MPKRSRDYVAIFINGERYNVGGQKCFLMLADFLRYELKLVGTKIVCAEGDCGACTVLCYRHQKNFEPSFLPINACIVMLAQLDGCHILTVEALKEGENLSPIQKSMVDNHASQCGFCTPGFAMAISAIFEKPCMLSEQKVKNCLTGNLCRCTGYQPIINAALSVDKALVKPLSERYLSQEKDDALGEAISLPLHIIDGDQEFFAPLSLDEAKKWRFDKKGSFIVGGATDIGVSINKDRLTPKPMLSLHLLKELYEISLIDDRVSVGARASLSELRKFLKKLVPSMASFLNIFASPQIKNIATLVGNIANGSPIGDSLPFMMVSDGRIHVVREEGSRVVPMDDLYKGYKSLSLKDDEIITHASFLVPKRSEVLRLEKVSVRKDLDISAVSAAFLGDIDKNGLFKEVKLALGGVGPVVIRLRNTEKFLAGQRFSEKLIDDAAFILQQEIVPLSDLRASADYRRMVADKLFRRFFKTLGPAC